MRSLNRALTRIHVVMLVLLVLVSVFAGAFYVYSTRLANPGPELPKASSTESPSPAPSLTETAAPSPTASPSPIGDSYEPDNSFNQYSTYNSSTIDSTVDYLGRQARTIFPVGDTDYIRVYLETGYTYYFSSYGFTETYASLYNSDQQLLASDNNTSFNKNFEIYYQINQTGYYFIVIGARTTEGDSGDYTFEISRSVTPLSVSVDNAIAQGLVQASFFGQGLQKVGLSIDSLSNSPLQITLIAGTKFQSQSEGVQSMIVLINTFITLDSYEKNTIYVSTACINMNSKMPGTTDTFTISHIIPSDLSKLLNASSFQAETFRVKQFAIWTITDNPTRDGYTEIGTTNNYSAPSDAEMQSILTLFQTAGIDTLKYQAFQ